MNVNQNNKPRRGDSTVVGAQRRGLRWTVGIGLWPIRKTAMSALLLLFSNAFSGVTLYAKCSAA